MSDWQGKLKKKIKKIQALEICNKTQNMMTVKLILHCGIKLAHITPQVFVEISHFPAELHTFQ